MGFIGGYSDFDFNMSREEIAGEVFEDACCEGCEDSFDGIKWLDGKTYESRQRAKDVMERVSVDRTTAVPYLGLSNDKKPVKRWLVREMFYCG